MENKKEVPVGSAEHETVHTDAHTPWTPLVYGELRAAARRQLRRLRPGQTLDTTALVHEAYLKLADTSNAQWRDRTHFISVAAVAMRHLLVDYARQRAAQKRGGGEQQVTLEDHLLPDSGRPLEILEVHQALESLALRSAKLSHLVELRFFGGLTVQETAQVLGTSERTVKREWRKARAYLYRQFSPSPNPTGTP